VVSSIAIASDFDNTMLNENTAKRLILYFLLHGEEGLWSRMKMVCSLTTRKLRHVNMRVYYALLRKIPVAERDHLLAQMTLNPWWLQSIQDLRFRRRAREIHLTIVSRNCVDIVAAWVRINEAALLQKHIVVEQIIANKPLDDTKNEFVVESGDLHHFHHAGNGQLHLEGKTRFVSKYEIYLGDAAEEVMREKVEEFVRV
jgi:hypothetical protein